MRYSSEDNMDFIEAVVGGILVMLIFLASATLLGPMGFIFALVLTAILLVVQYIKRRSS